MYIKSENPDKNLDMMLYLIFVKNVTKCKPCNRGLKRDSISARNRKPSNTISYEFRRVQQGFKSYEQLKKEEV